MNIISEHTLQLYISSETDGLGTSPLRKCPNVQMTKKITWKWNFYKKKMCTNLCVILYLHSSNELHSSMKDIIQIVYINLKPFVKS